MCKRFLLILAICKIASIFLPRPTRFFSVMKIIAATSTSTEVGSETSRKRYERHIDESIFAQVIVIRCFERSCVQNSRPLKLQIMELKS